jgi:hypothetical protein
MSSADHDNTIPTLLDHLTEAWVQRALQRNIGVVSVERIGAGVGILGVLARIHLDDGSTVIAKIGSEFAETIELVKAYGFYEAEAGFYRDVAGRDIGLRVPQCHSVSVSPDGGAVALLLEDLGGGRTVDQIAGCPLTDAEQVVDALAVFHARWWQNPELDRMPWLRNVNNPAYLAGQATYQQVWPLFKQQHAGRWSAAAMSIAERFGEQYADIVNREATTRPQSLVHMDLRLDNLFFDLPDGSPFAVLDWQLTVRSTGVHDISYFVVESLETELRRNHEERLVRRWHESITACGISGYSFDNAWRDYRMSVVSQLAIPIVGSFMPQANDRGRQLVDTMADRAMKAVEDHLPNELLLV